MKRVEFSEDMKTWKTLGEWSEEEVKEKWEKLQQWINDTQVYGFFRMVDND